MKLVILALLIACANDDDRHFPVIPGASNGSVKGSHGASFDAGLPRDAGPIVQDGKTLPPTDAAPHTDANPLPAAQH